jgi:hypothetical protein
MLTMLAREPICFACSVKPQAESDVSNPESWRTDVS